MDYTFVTRCKECKHKSECSYKRGDDWFCADGEPITNTVVNDTNSGTGWMESIFKSVFYKDDIPNTQLSMITPKCCQACPNHPNNGGNGICNCSLPDLTDYKLT